MSTTGLLTDLSLREIFLFINKGNKTGVLRLSALPSQTSLPPVHYIWAHQGRIVAVANRLDHQGLISLIKQRHWFSNQVITKLFQLYAEDKPLGLCLKNHGILSTEQLKHLFQIQVLQSICTLFQLKDGIFKFDQNVPIPMQEMTGLSIPAVDLNQYSLIKVLSDKIENRCLDRCLDSISLPVSSR
jgi:hypothetical protein